MHGAVDKKKGGEKRGCSLAAIILQINRGPFMNKKLKKITALDLC